MAMNTSALCLVSAMDRLWYHQIILWSDPLSSSHAPNFDPTLPFTKFPSCPSPSPLPFSPLTNETIPSSLSSSVSSNDDISLNSQEGCSNEEDKEREVEKRESTEKRPNNLKFSVGRKMNKSISCRRLGELELEEVKGFIDLGFEFKSENLSPQMVTLLPGLQRLGISTNKQKIKLEDEEEEDENDEEDHKRDKSRPYLSEAWTTKRPNSPLLNLMMPKVSSTSDMKKHLKFWAKFVASEIQQES